MKVQPLSSASQCIPWLVVLIIECLAIVILNIITIVVFVKKKRQLQRRRTYLIIHLAIVDLLVGVVSGPLQIEHIMGWSCPLWNYIAYFMQFLYLLSVYLTSSLLSKYGVVVIPNSILDQKEKENWRVLRLSSHLYLYFVFYQRWYMQDGLATTPIIS